MEPVVTLIIVGAWAAGGLIASQLLSREAITRRALTKSRPVPVREFPVGRIAKVVGRVRRLGAPLVAPLSSRRCVIYQVWVRPIHSQLTPGAPPTEWFGQDFLLVDAAGSGALVKVDGASVALTRDVRATIDVVGTGDPRARAYLQQLASRSPIALSPNPPLEVVEAVLEEGELAAVCGTGGLEVDPAPEAPGGGAVGYRGPPQRLVLRASEKSPLLLSDDPRTTR